MPTKIIKASDSLVTISAFVIKALKGCDYNVDDLHEKVNELYYKKISIDKLFLSLNFLFIIGKIKITNEIITIKI